MARLFWLSDEARAVIAPHRPRGKPRGDDRRVISGILHLLKTGCRWRDLPSAYGPAGTIYNRHNGRARRGPIQGDMVHPCIPLREGREKRECPKPEFGGSVWQGPGRSAVSGAGNAACHRLCRAQPISAEP